MIARSLLAATPDDLAAQLREAMDASAFSPTLAIVFVDLGHDLSSVGDLLAERDVALVGATTRGAAADGRMVVGASSALLLDLSRDAFRIFTSQQDESSSDAAVRLGAEANAWFDDPIALVFAAGVRSGDSVVAGIVEGAGRALPIFGGMAGADFKNYDNGVFTSDAEPFYGLVAVVLDGARVAVDSVSSAGWKPVGIELEVTRSDGTLVHEIEGRPVLDVYRSYLDLDEADAVDLLADADPVRHIGSHHPLSVRVGDASPFMRTPGFLDIESGGVVFAGEVPQGARVRFCMPPSFEVIERVVADGEVLRDRVPDADAVLVVSCKSRHAALGPYAEDEIRALSTLWDAPQIGFFAYGEFGPGFASGQSFHNSTCTLIALRAR